MQKENAFTERFWGRISLHTGTSLYYFSKGGRTQKLIHHLKYHNKQNIGVKLGNLLGGFLSEAPLYQDVDLIIPVPLHAKRERFRGYNQSDLFAKGLSEAMQIQWQKNILVRNQMTDTQTKKSRIDRFKNVENAFSVVQPQAIQNKHILIVDDVLTTGATLEACANQILKIPGTTVSLATIAFAEN